MNRHKVFDGIVIVGSFRAPPRETNKQRDQLNKIKKAELVNDR